MHAHPPISPSLSTKVPWGLSRARTERSYGKRVHLSSGKRGRREQEATRGEGLCTRAWSDRTRGDGFELKEGRCRLDIRKEFFTLRVVRPWPRLPREAVASPSLAVFKARLDGALSNLVWWKVSLLVAGGLE